jgi:hypothetical protein
MQKAASRGGGPSKLLLEMEQLWSLLVLAIRRVVLGFRPREFSPLDHAPFLLPVKKRHCATAGDDQELWQPLRPIYASNSPCRITVTGINDFLQRTSDPYD